MNAERPPTDDELAAMAYADGELAPDARAAFERRLASDPRLAREVASQRRIAVLARSFAPPEPMDAEWASIARSPGQRTMRGTGFTLLVSGALLLLVYGEWELFMSAAPLAVKIGATAIVVGLVLLAVSALRARARTRAFDPYEDVQR